MARTNFLKQTSRVVTSPLKLFIYANINVYVHTCALVFLFFQYLKYFISNIFICMNWPFIINTFLLLIRYKYANTYIHKCIILKKLNPCSDIQGLPLLGPTYLSSLAITTVFPSYSQILLIIVSRWIHINRQHLGFETSRPGFKHFTNYHNELF